MNRYTQVPDSQAIAVTKNNLLSSLETALSKGYGMEIMYQHSLKKVEIDPEENWEVSLEFQNGETHTCDVLIGRADFVPSLIRSNFFDDNTTSQGSSSSSSSTSMSQWWVSGVAEIENWSGNPDVCFEVDDDYDGGDDDSTNSRTVGWRGVLFDEKHSRPASSGNNDADPAAMARYFKPAPPEIIEAISSTNAQDIVHGSVQVYPPPKGSLFSQYGGRIILTGSAAHSLPDALNQDVAMNLESVEALAMSMQQACEKYGPDSDIDETSESMLASAVKKYQDTRYSRVSQVCLEAIEDQKMLNTSSSIMPLLRIGHYFLYCSSSLLYERTLSLNPKAGLRSTAEWMNSFSHDLQDKQLIAYDIFSAFGDTAHRRLS
eukprot:jgi/Bigna1/72000/fgenesh1_pg.18_\